MLKAALAPEARADRVIADFVASADRLAALAEERSPWLWRHLLGLRPNFLSSFGRNRPPRPSPAGDTGFGRARPHAVRPRTVRTIQINKHAPMNPAIR
jgi:hypothetical protein